MRKTAVALRIFDGQLDLHLSVRASLWNLLLAHHYQAHSRYDRGKKRCNPYKKQNVFVFTEARRQSGARQNSFDYEYDQGANEDALEHPFH